MIVFLTGIGNRTARQAKPVTVRVEIIFPGGAIQFVTVWHDGWFTGRWRELNDLVALIPGLREAIVDQVTEHGSPYGPGKRALFRTDDHVGWQEDEQMA